MAKKVSASAKKVTKKRVKKNVEHGQAHIQASFNNTIVTLTDAAGNALFSTDEILSADSGFVVKTSKVFMKPGVYPRLWK